MTRYAANPFLRTLEIMHAVLFVKLPESPFTFGCPT